MEGMMMKKIRSIRRSSLLRAMEDPLSQAWTISLTKI
jgi:hypothetical protein